MKRFEIHGSVRWGLRVVYVTLIFVLAVYIGLGIFLKSNLAKDALTKQLSLLVGRPVEIGRLSLDWFRGLHIVLEAVEIPGEEGALSWLKCRRLVATIRILRFLGRRRVVFTKLAVNDGEIHIIRARDGSWKGVLPLPGGGRRHPSGQGKKGPAGGTVFLFPDIKFSRIALFMTLQSQGGDKRLTLYVAKGRATYKRGVFRAEATGDLSLNHSPQRARLYAHVGMTPSSPVPLKGVVRLRGLALSDFFRWWKGGQGMKAGGLAALTLSFEGRPEKWVTFRCGLFARDARVGTSHWRFRATTRTVECKIAGRAENLGESPLLSTVHVEIAPFKARYVKLERKRGREARRITKSFSFKGVKFGGVFAREEATFRVNLQGQFGVGGEVAQPSCRFSLKGSYTFREEGTFGAVCTVDELPVEKLLTSEIWPASVPRISSELANPQERKGLRVIDRLRGECKGKGGWKNPILQHVQATLRWGGAHIVARTGEFRLFDERPVVLEIKGKNIPATTVKYSPLILARLSREGRRWCEAMEAGMVSLDKGRLVLKRGKAGALKAVEVQAGILSVSDMSITLPRSEIFLEGLGARFVYRAPKLTLTDLRCHAANACGINIVSAEIEDVRRRPVKVRCSGRIDVGGLTFSRGVESSALSGLVREGVAGKIPFVPKYVEGGVDFSFRGTLLPFSWEDYRLSFKEVRVDGIVEGGKRFPDAPITILATGSAYPHEVNIEKISFVSPLGGVSLRGKAEVDRGQELSLVMSYQGQIMLKESLLHTFLPSDSPFRMEGIMPFSLKGSGRWPSLSIEGHVSGTSLVFGYRDIFLKKRGVPSAIDFQIEQVGPTSLRIQWLRAMAGNFVMKMWGEIDSFAPARGTLRYQVDSHEISALLPLFPRFCDDPYCLMAKGSIRGDGALKFGETPGLNFGIRLENLEVPFPKTHEPIRIRQAALVYADKRRTIELQTFTFKHSMGRKLEASAVLEEGQWFWNTEVDMASLDMDDFMDMIWGEGNPSESTRESPDLFVRIMRWMHGRYVRGVISIDALKIFDYRLQDYFSRFSQRGVEGEIKGLNFLTAEGYGAVDVHWREKSDGRIHLLARPMAKNLLFGKILSGLLRKDAPFTGRLTFRGELEGMGASFLGIRKTLSGHLVVRYERGVIKRWKVLSDIFGFLDVYDIFKGFKDITNKEGLGYEVIEGTIRVKQGVAETGNAYLKSRPFYIAGEGQLNLESGVLSLLIGVYPFKLLDKFISSVPVIGRVLTDKNKKFLGYFFRVEGPVTSPEVTSVNIESYGKSIFNTFKKILTLPFYPFMNHTEKEEKK